MRAFQLDLNDLMKVCLVLDQVVKQRTAEDNAFLDSTVGKPLTDVEVTLGLYGENRLDELWDLRNRLFNQIPRDML